MAKLEVENFEQFRALEGQAIPEGDWLRVTQNMIDDFAKATMDFQWIHTDIKMARHYSPYKSTVAHGFMSLALISKFLKDSLLVKSSRMSVNYGLNKVRFPAPVVSGSRLKLTGKISCIEDYGDGGLKITWNCVVLIEGSDKPACVAEYISLMFEK